MIDDEKIDAIYKAKIDGLSDMVIMDKFTVGLRDIEQAIIKKTGINLNLFQESPVITRLAPKKFSLETSTVWSFKSRGKWATHSGNYRGNWSPYIPRNLLLRYTQPGDLILDQFCGGGTTAVEAKLLGRRCIARDLNPGAVLLTRNNLDFRIQDQETLEDSSPTITYYEPIVEIGDARDLHGIDNESIDMVCTHPPYANIVQYTDGIDGDLSQHDVDGFIEQMEDVAKECFRVTKPGKYCAILIGDMRRNKRVIPLGFRTIELFLQQGFILHDLVIKRQHNCRTTGFWYSNSIKYNFLLLAQEYLPIFLKPETKNPNLHHKKIFFETEKLAIPNPPKEMQCKTTWVLEERNLSEQRDANLLNRYSKDGNAIRFRLTEFGDKETLQLETDYFDLVYLEAEENYQNIQSLKNAISLILDAVSEKVKDGGHIAIMTKDYIQKEQIVSPAIEIWRSPLTHFHIREIIVVTPDSVEIIDSSDLQISHQYILVYQKLKI